MASYRVVLRGVEPGKDPELALRSLAALSRTGVDALRPHLGSGHLVVKRGVDRETAARYHTAIRQTGWLCAVEQEVAAEASATAVRTPAVSASKHNASPSAAAAATTALPPAPARTQAPPRRKLKTIAAFAAATAAIVLGAGLYFNWRTIGSRVDIVGKWNCLPTLRSMDGKKSRNYVVVFGSDGKFSMTSVMSYEIQFTGVYRRNRNQILVTLQGGATMRENAANVASVDLKGRFVRGSSDEQTSPPTIANMELTGQVVGGSSDQFDFELAVPYLLYKTWSCSRL